MKNFTIDRNLEGKIPYAVEVFRRDHCNIQLPYTLFVLQETFERNLPPTKLVQGGIARAINVKILQFYLTPNFDEIAIFLISNRNNTESGFHQRIFVRPKKGITRFVDWALYRMTFGRLGDIPLEIVGIKPVEADELILLKQLTAI